MQKIIAERYEILDLIGQGGMADVYLARDTILNRTIAIKILRTGLAKDPVYVTRFQREASAAAALSHKNIVEIYDVGEDGNQYYIVMEYVPGTTLKELISKRGALHVVEAIDIMKQVVAGTAKAHQLGIVHRDLKPQNILVTDSGTAKIADFGIASMQSLAQVTQTDVIMGSLHYLAPELARGEKATNQSDIYALGIVLYELLRGEVPFNGESPVNIALKHMQEELPSIREFNPSIPQSVENIITKATAKNLKDRYHNVSAMLDDITYCMEREEEKLVFTYAQNEDPTIVLDPRSMYNGQTGEMKDVSKDTSDEKEKKGLLSKIAALPLAAKIGMGVGAAVLIGLLVYFLFFRGGSTDTNLMPDLAGKTQEEAKDIMKEYEVTFDDEMTEELSDKYEKGQIIKTDPAKGKSIKKDDVIKLTISSGKYIVIGDYLGKDYVSIKKDLEDQGFYVDIKEEVSDEKAGTILEQSLSKNTKVDPNDEDKEITLTVSKGSAIVIDNYVGMTYDQAYAELDGLGFKITKVEVEDDATAGTVIAQSKNSGTSFDPDGDLTITLTVSKGKSYSVPSVIGMNYESAKTYLESLGYKVKTEKGMTAASGPDSFAVYQQTPNAGTTESSPGTVTLTYYGEFKEETGDE
ncbi:MAG: Stk1 family PASTA domain-containing Ser/Thr kinase [Coprobacillaceae bacterium]